MSEDALQQKRARQAERQRAYRARRKTAGIKSPPLTDEQKEARRLAAARYRERQRAAGIKEYNGTEEDRRKNREKIALLRAKAKADGRVLATDTWWKRNSEAHRERTQKWRQGNLDRSREITRGAQARRRSTPWGAINNRMWPIVHRGVRLGSGEMGLYNQVLGYTWADLREHLEAQFTPDMNWDNWGDLWHVDHINPLSSYKYESVADPLFKEAWALSNLRPLLKEHNMQKGSKIVFDEATNFTTPQLEKMVKYNR